MPQNLFRISGVVVDRQTRRGVPGLRVEAWHKEPIVSQLIGTSTTTGQGAFRITASQERMKKFFIPPKPDVFFKVYNQDRLLKSTEDAVLRGVESGRSDIVIEIDFAFTDPEEESVFVSSDGEVFLLNLSSARLVSLLAQQLAAADASSGRVSEPVVWTDGDSAVIVHPSKLRVALKPGLILIELTLESDQTGRALLVAPFSVGATLKDATLVAVTEDVPRGDALLASRWGHLAQNAVWDALVRIGQERLRSHVANDELVAAGLFTTGDKLSCLGTRAFTAAELGEYFAEVRRGNPNFDPRDLDPPDFTLLPGSAQTRQALLQRRKKSRATVKRRPKQS